MNNQKISVVIPVRNGARTLGRCLESLRDQTIGDHIEIIIPDSMSDDESRQIALEFGARIIDIPLGTFNHGLTRNVGVQHSSGELIYFTVQDAWIRDKNMFERMASHFSNTEIKAVCGHQAVPHEKDKNPVLWFRPVSKAETKIKSIPSRLSMESLPIVQQQELISLDNVVAMYRKECLVQLPFVRTEYGEDRIWAYNALNRGWKLLFDSSLIVYHYHHHEYRYAFSSTYTAAFHFYKAFSYKAVPPPFVLPVIKSTYQLLNNKDLSFKEKVYWIIYNLKAQFGYLSATLNFMMRLKFKGESGIEQGYKKYCTLIPQGYLKN